MLYIMQIYIKLKHVGMVVHRDDGKAHLTLLLCGIPFVHTISYSVNMFLL